jgi:hypothetical protein
MFKCKWYNPKTSSYSEELIPSVILGIVNDQTRDLEKINSGINENLYIIINLKNNFELEDSSKLVFNNIIKPVELIYNHYYYRPLHY